MFHPLWQILKWVKYLLSKLKRSIIKPADYVIIDLYQYTKLFPESSSHILTRVIKRKIPTITSLKCDIEQIAKDHRVQGVVFKLSGIKLPYALLEEIANNVTYLRQQGMSVYCWSKHYNTNALFIASYCDEVLLQPGGQIDSLGFKSEMMFYRDLLHRIGLHFDVYKVSPYKTAADSLTRSAPSEEAYAMVGWILDNLYNNLTRKFIEARNISPQAFDTIIDGLPYTDEEALSQGLIDKVINEEALPHYLAKKKTNDRPDTQTKDTDISGEVKVEDLNALRKKILPLPPRKKAGLIGFVNVEGMIIDGKSKTDQNFNDIYGSFALLGKRCGDATVIEQLRKMALNPKIKGVLLFIDSGGGSATASEAIASAIKSLTEKKPVVALMGEKAASGGYYIASQASHIIAYPATLTGSIGVLAGKLVHKKFLDNLLINKQTIEKGKTNIFEGDDHLSVREREIIEKNILRTYDLFLDRVAEGRNIDKETIKGLAKGKIWTGEQAYHYGLVDQLGGVQAAEEKLKTLTDLTEIKFTVMSPGSGYRLPNWKSPGDKLFEEVALWEDFFDGKTPLCLSELLMEKTLFHSSEFDLFDSHF